MFFVPKLYVFLIKVSKKHFRLKETKCFFEFISLVMAQYASPLRTPVCKVPIDDVHSLALFKAKLFMFIYLDGLNYSLDFQSSLVVALAIFSLPY